MSYIYFVQEGDTGPIKIGWTAGGDFVARLRLLQVGNPRELFWLGIIEGTRHEERRLHSRFRADRIAGEWFEPSPSLLKLIAEAEVHSPDLGKTIVGPARGRHEQRRQPCEPSWSASSPRAFWRGPVSS